MQGKESSSTMNIVCTYEKMHHLPKENMPSKHGKGSLGVMSVHIWTLLKLQRGNEPSWHGKGSLGIVSAHMWTLDKLLRGNKTSWHEKKVPRPPGIVSVHMGTLHEQPRGNEPFWHEKGFSSIASVHLSTLNELPRGNTVNLLGLEKVSRPQGTVSVHVRTLHKLSRRNRPSWHKKKVLRPLGIVPVHMRTLHELPRGSKPSWHRKCNSSIRNVKCLIPRTGRLFRECKRSPSRDARSFPTWGNVKKIYGWREKCPGVNSVIFYPW